jgi:hypothetical protein
MRLLTFFNECTTAPLTYYENSRAQQIIKNNQIFQRPGIGALVSLLKNPRPSLEDEDPKKLGSEYEAQESEGCEEEVIKVQILFDYTTVCIMSMLRQVRDVRKKKSAKCKFSLTILLCV